MPSLAVVIAYEALSEATGRRPHPRRKKASLSTKAVQFLSKIRWARLATPNQRDDAPASSLRVATPAKRPLPVPGLGAAH